MGVVGLYIGAAARCRYPRLAVAECPFAGLFFALLSSWISFSHAFLADSFADLLDTGRRDGPVLYECHGG